jgi:hypothetical protein
VKFGTLNASDADVERAAISSILPDILKFARLVLVGGAADFRRAEAAPAISRRHRDPASRFSTTRSPASIPTPKSAFWAT